MKYSKYIFIGLILLIIPGCTTKEWQESSYLKGLGLKGKIIAKSNDIYIIDLNTKQRIPINIINTEKIGLYVTGIPIWGKDENIILPTKNGIVELNGEKQIVLKNESMIMSVLFDKENNQIFYVNGHLEIKRVSLTYKTEKLIRGKEVIGSWISYFNNKIAFQSRNGTKVLDIKNNSIIEEYRNYNFYTFSPDGKVAYIKENDSKEGSKDQLIIENNS